MERVIMDYETVGEIEVAVARHFGTRKHVIVPNVSHGMFNYEMDLCMLNLRSMYASEVEIKISKSDLKADAKKVHHHECSSIRYLWFAMPEKLRNCEEYVPAGAGILLVTTTGYVAEIRKPAVRPTSKWSYEKAFRLARLGTLRIWNLKQILIQREKA
jgi:hypothetical protein